MTNVTQILLKIDKDPSASEELLPLVYEELRKLAAAKLNHEKPGQTLQPTALVHEAYLRLVGATQVQEWESRRHFFAAAAESMRRILVENARRKTRKKRGGEGRRQEISESDAVALPMGAEMLDLDEALSRFAEHEPRAAELAKLRFFTGMTVEEAAAALQISSRTSQRDWAYARAWLSRAMKSYEEAREE